MEISKSWFVALEEFEWNGETVMEGEKVELTDEEAASLLESGKIEPVTEEEEDEEDLEDEEDEDDDEEEGEVE